MKRVFVLSIILSAFGCDPHKTRAPDKEWRIFVSDKSGTGIAGAEVYLTYPSSTYAPKFVTDKTGMALLDVERKSDLHSIVVVYAGQKKGIPSDSITWPLRIAFP